MMAILILAIQIGLNLYGVPTPITFQFGQSNSQTIHDSATPASSVNVSRKPSERDEVDDAGPKPIRLEENAPGPPGPDFAGQLDVAEPIGREPAQPMRDHMRRLLDRLKSGQ